MSLGAAAFSELVTSTLDKIGRDQLHDNVFTKHPSLDFLKQEIGSETGTALRVNLELAENTSTQYTDASGSFDTSVSGEIMGAALFQWSDPLVSSVRIRWKDLKMNSGRQQIVNLLKSHIRNMEKSHAKKIAQDLHRVYRVGMSPYSGVDPAQFNPLDAIVSDATYDADTTGGKVAFTVGQIDASAQPLWQATRVEIDLTETVTIRQAMRHVSNEIFVSTGANTNPDVMIAGRDIFEEFEDSFDDKVRYDSFENGQTRFRQISHGDLVVRLDPDCPPKRAYFLDRSSWVVKSLAGTFMETQPTQKIPGTLDHVTPVASVLAVGVNERRANGVLLRPATSGGAA